MKDLFQFSGLKVTGGDKEDAVFTITLKTTVAPEMVGKLYPVLASLSYRQVIVNIEAVQSVIPGSLNVETGEIRAFVRRKAGN